MCCYLLSRRISQFGSPTRSQPGSYLPAKFCIPVTVFVCEIVNLLMNIGAMVGGCRLLWVVIIVVCSREEKKYGEEIAVLMLVYIGSEESTIDILRSSLLRR